MYRILQKRSLATGIHMYVISAPEIAAKALPGQFIILRVDEWGERIPLTIFDFDRKAGSIKIIFQEVGFTTKRLACLKQGDFITDIAGPLGMPSHIKKYGRVIAIGGGVGAAPIFPIVRALKEAGNEVISIIGAKSAETLILQDVMNNVSDRLIICTDDGSLGEKGFVTEVLQKQLTGEKPDLVMAIGPLPMMQAVSELTASFAVKTLVSLNPIMVDGTGMCGACRVKIGEETKFACVEGPEFDGHLVDWETLIRRSTMYAKEQELILGEKARSGGGCGCHS
ncbi:sulfide/dihydroorotate dehydrogenase-like FAD/NAD-binding protein [Thermincola ferriacetica]